MPESAETECRTRFKMYSKQMHSEALMGVMTVARLATEEGVGILDAW